jgi:Mrp family chromosome partitioning ATPase
MARRGVHSPDAGAGLSVLPSGRCQVAATNLLYRAHLPELLARLAADYDMILIDAPPMLQIPDARVLGRVSDAVILWCAPTRPRVTQRRPCASGWPRYGTPLLGTILNDWNPKTSDGGYYGKYEKYYSKG